MNKSTTTRSSSEPVDQDLAEQARPGHGVPSQDPDPAAQFPQDPAALRDEVQSVMTGGGVVAGVATGATIGVVAGGPAGAVVGAALGAVAGAFGGAAAAAKVNAEESSSVDKAPADRV